MTRLRFLFLAAIDGGAATFMAGLFPRWWAYLLFVLLLLAGISQLLLALFPPPPEAGR